MDKPKPCVEFKHIFLDGSGSDWQKDVSKYSVDIAGAFNVAINAAMERVLLK